MPWLNIITSRAVWAIIFANFCNDWALYTYLTSIPTFYKEVLFFDIESVSCVLTATVCLSLSNFHLPSIDIMHLYGVTLSSLTFTLVFDLMLIICILNLVICIVWFVSLVYVSQQK